MSQVINRVLKVARNPERVLSRLFEQIEGFEQSHPDIPVTRHNLTNSHIPRQLEDEQLRNLKSLLDTNLDKNEDTFSVLVGVGRKLRRHSHKFNIERNEDGDYSLSYIDPEGYVGRRDASSPEISQLLRLELKADGDYSLYFLRLSSQADTCATYSVKTMQNVETLCAKIQDIKDLSALGKVYSFIADTPEASQISQNHWLGNANSVVRYHQISRIIGHLEELVKSGHMRPTSDRHFHCEAGATCTP